MWISVVLALGGPAPAAPASATATDQVPIATPRVQPPPVPSREAIPQAPKPTPSLAPMTTDEQIAAFLRASPTTPWQAAERLDALSDAPVREIHGEAGVAVGTGGFRSAYVQSDIPVGRNGTLSLFVQQTQGRGHGYGYGNSFGSGGPSGRSLGLSLDLSAPGQTGFCRPTYGDRTPQRGDTSRSRFNRCGSCPAGWCN